MKKFFSTLILVTAVFTFTAFADDPPIVTCVDGHMHLPGYACQPPNGNGNGNRNAPEDSTFTYIKTLIDEFNPFVYFLS